jgi:hypothetical protein
MKLTYSTNTQQDASLKYSFREFSELAINEKAISKMPQQILVDIQVCHIELIEVGSAVWTLLPTDRPTT